jgi:hypothetical protein
VALFQDTRLTNRGRNLLAKAAAGVELRFTKAAAGSGIADEADIDGLETVVSPKLECQAVSAEFAGNGAYSIRFVLSNLTLTEGFAFTEMGVYAEDPDVGEILYCYTRTLTPEEGDYIPEYRQDGGEFREYINVMAYIANASNVTIEVGNFTTAEDVAYDNDLSGLDAVTVQAALDEIALKISSPAQLEDIDAAIEDVAGRIGMENDSAASNGVTLFALVKWLVYRFVGNWTDTRAAKLDSIGLNNDASGTTTLFARLKQIYSYLSTTLNDAISGIDTKIGVTGGESVVARLTGLETAIANLHPAGTMKSVQRGILAPADLAVDMNGKLTDTTVTISAINPAKAIAIVNGTYSYFSSGSGGITVSHGAIVKSITETSITISGLVNPESSFIYKGGPVSWQVIEFY